MTSERYITINIGPKFLTETFAAPAGVHVTADERNRVYIDGHELCNGDALRLAQVLIEAHQRAQVMADMRAAQPASREG